MSSNDRHSNLNLTANVCINDEQYESNRSNDNVDIVHQSIAHYFMSSNWTNFN